jgi:N-acetylglucosaminyl-diphospho-decaprenol L-rhamnosyltransferase
MGASIDVIIPVHGGWGLTQRCLDSLARQTAAHRTVVVDNASPDDTVGQLRAGWADIDLVEMGANRGFAAACNRGFATTDGDVVVLLNNDIEADPDFLERLAAPLRRDPRCGMVAPYLLRPGRERIDSVGILSDRTLAGFSRLHGAPPNMASSSDEHLLGPTGAAAGYRRKALEEVGGLDEQIFMYGEDLDLALRIRAAGWTAVPAIDAVAVHVGGASAGVRSAWQREQMGFARGYLLRRWGMLRSRAAVRTLVTETLVVVGDLAISRDTAAFRGRLRGWRSARGMTRRSAPADGIDRNIGFMKSLRMRRGVYHEAHLEEGR